MAAENVALPKREINYISKNIQIENILILQNIAIFTACLIK